MQTSGNKIVSHTSIYLFGDILRYSVSLVMLPIYTRFLTTADYGVIELLNMLIDFSSIIFGARIAQSVFRFYYTADNDKDRKLVISSAIIMDFVLNGIGAAAVMLCAAPLSQAIFSDVTYTHYVIMIAASMLLVPLLEVPLTHVRAQQKPWLFFGFSLAKLTIQVSLNIWLVVVKEMHVEGVLWSTLISSTVMGVILCGYSLSTTGIRISLATCRKLFVFSMPLKLATLGSFYLTFGDRYLLNVYRELSEVGVYSLGYKFGFIFTLLAWTPFEKMWESERYLIHESPDARLTYQRVFLNVNFLLVLCGLCISVFSKDLLRIMSAPSFWTAYQIIPVIILAYIFQAWSKYCNFGLLLHHNTMQIAYAELLASAVITVAYLALIPRYGMHGAAWATVIGFLVRFYWTNRQSNRFYDMDLPWLRVCMMLALAILAFMVSLLIPDNLVLSISLRIVLVGTFLASFFALPIISSEEKRVLLGNVRRLAGLAAR